jgi:hypothetical protein
VEARPSIRRCRYPKASAWMRLPAGMTYVEARAVSLYLLSWWLLKVEADVTWLDCGVGRQRMGVNESWVCR